MGNFIADSMVWVSLQLRIFDFEQFIISFFFFFSMQQKNASSHMFLVSLILEELEGASKRAISHLQTCLQSYHFKMTLTYLKLKDDISKRLLNFQPLGCRLMAEILKEALYRLVIFEIMKG